MALLLLLKRPSPFAFPGVAPGFDPSHVASQGLPLSVATVGGKMVDLISSHASVSANPTVSVINGNIGPAVKLSPATDTAQAFAGRNPTFLNTNTMAFIGSQASASAQYAMVTMGTSGVDSGYPFLTSSNATSMWAYALQGNALIPLFGSYSTPLNVPHFFAVSASHDAGGTTVQLNAVLTNLLTGQTLSSTLSTASGNPFQGTTYNIGSRGAASLSFDGQIAVAMASNTFLPLGELQQWASDPWSFWYPRKFDLSMMLRNPPASASLVSVTQSWPSLGRQIEVIGAD